MSLPDKEQLDRFREAARKAEADTSDDALDRVFGKLDLKRKPEVEADEKQVPHDDAK